MQRGLIENRSQMAECATPAEDTFPSDSEDEKEIYDVPPKRYSRTLHTEADYMNFKELEVIPAPMLPPKKRSSIDLEAKFGPSTPLPGASGGEFFGSPAINPCLPAVTPNGPGLSSMGSVRKIPVPAPRNSKQPVAPPRRSRMNGSPALLSDITTTDSLDGNSFVSDPPKVVADWCNNNLGELSNQNVFFLIQGQESRRSDVSLGGVYQLAAEPVDTNCEKNPGVGFSDVKTSRHDYVNTGGVLGELSKLPNGNVTKPQEYENVSQCFSLFTPSSVDLKPPDLVTRQVTAAAIYPSIDIGNTSMVPAVPPVIPREAAVRVNDQQRPKVTPESKQEKVNRDYQNVDQNKTNDYTNVSHCMPIDGPGVDMKALLAQCFELPKPPSHPAYPALTANKPQHDATTCLTATMSSGDINRHNGNLAPLNEPFYEFVPNEDINLANDFAADPFADLLTNRSSFSCRNSLGVFSTSPPNFNPPPLPSDLLIDFSDGDLYKVPSSQAPVVPDRPVPPPVPARRGTLETLTESGESEPCNIPVSQKEVQVVVPPPSVAVTGPAGRNASRPLPKLVASPSQQSQPTEAGGRSRFYVEPSHSNYYEVEPVLVSYEMDSSMISRLSNNSSISSSQTSSSEQTNLHRTGSLDVSHQGFLYFGSSAKVEKKWCTLDIGCLNVFASNQMPILLFRKFFYHLRDHFLPQDVNQPQEVIERVSMVSVASIKDNSRQGHWFEVSTRPPSVIYQFSAETLDEKNTWINHIARNIALINMTDLDQIVNVERGGNVFVRFGAESEWIHTWIHLVHKTLYIYNKDEEFEEVDLRKSKGLRNLQLTDRCTKGFETCPPLSVDFPSARVIYIQSDLKKDQDGWYSALRNSMMVIDNSLSSQALTADNVPVIVDKCINFVAAFGMEMEGIYRLNGQNSKVTKVLDDFRSDLRGMILRFTEYPVHDVATALKRFFRQLDDPLLTSKYYDGWIEASGIENQDTRLDAYKSLLSCLPVVNYCTLKRLITHVTQVAGLKALNKMDSTNLASIFGPILLKVDKDNQQATGYGTTNQEIKIIRDFVDNHTWLFDIREEEVDQEKKIAEAVKRIEQLNLARNSQLTNTIFEEGVLLGIYINSREGDVVTVKVASTMTAEELHRYVAGKAHVASSSDWALFEVICNGELERPIHYSEKVLAVTMKWSEWPLDFCQKNYLCFKFNKLYETLQLVHDPHLSLFSELKYTSKKSFHKYFFQYSQYSLGYRKDSRAENPTTSWHIEDIVIYVGVQQIRNPPNTWGFTFYTPKERLTSPYFGQSICCCTEEELYRWLSAMFYSQHPDGFILPSDNSGAPDNSHKQLNQYHRSPPIGAQNFESTPQPSSSLASKWKLPFQKRR